MKTEQESMREVEMLPREVVLSSGYPPSPGLSSLIPRDSLHGPLAP